jgi:hypothetical protein
MTSAAADLRPIPRRATSTGAAFMQRHLQTAFPSAPGGAERDPPICEHEWSTPTSPKRGPGPAPAPVPAAQCNSPKQKSSPQREKDKGKGGSKKAAKRERAATEKEAGSGAAKKRSVREKLMGWIHKLGSSSSSSASSR